MEICSSVGSGIESLPFFLATRVPHGLAQPALDGFGVGVEVEGPRDGLLSEAQPLVEDDLGVYDFGVKVPTLVQRKREEFSGVLCLCCVSNTVSGGVCKIIFTNSA